MRAVVGHGWFEFDPMLIVVIGGGHATVVAAGSALVARGARTERLGVAAKGVALVSLVLGWTSLMIGLGEGWPAAAVLPTAVMVGALLYARGRRDGRRRGALAGAALVVVSVLLAFEPLYETWSFSLGAPITMTAIAWAGVGALLFAVGSERLRASPWNGWIPYARAPGGTVSSALGFALLALSPAFVAFMSNFET